jgi:SAM-dependent methyltransferase
MEENPGLPLDYFDLVISIYALGWTVNLPQTLALVHSYLKPGGVFIFSWEHPTYSCLEYQPEAYFFKHPYLEEGPVIHETWNGVRIVITHRRLSTFINTALSAGFEMQQLIEANFNPTIAREDHRAPERWYSVQRAQLCPTSFILKLRRPTH